MEQPQKRYRAFLSYSQGDKAITRRIHRVLERYRVPKGIEARLGPGRTLGRFFRDDDEMGASQSLGAALEGALDDSENLIVICSPASARSRWVDAEVRRFKRRGDAQVFAVIIEGVPHAAVPEEECFPPSLKVKIGPDGEPTGEPDEPRAPDLSKEGLKRVRAQLAAGLLGVPFDELWQRDRRRARRVRGMAAAATLVVVGVLGIAGAGWLKAQAETRTQAARQAVAEARGATADGRVSEALARLSPFLAHRETREVVESPLRALLGWVPVPRDRLLGEGIQLVQLRDAMILLDPNRNAYDVSDIGLALQRLIRSRDGTRLVAIGDQRTVVLDAGTGERLSSADHAGLTWLGHGFEAPSGLMLVTGAVLGPTNGSVVPHVLAISADGAVAEPHRIEAHMFWGSAVAVDEGCETMLVATGGSGGEWRVVAHGFDAAGLAAPVEREPLRLAGDQPDAAVAALSQVGQAFETGDAFMAYAEANPFLNARCLAPAEDRHFEPGVSEAPGAAFATIDDGLPVEGPEFWALQAVPVEIGPRVRASAPVCSDARPCPVVGGGGASVSFESIPRREGDRIGRPPGPRWLREAARQPLLDADQAIYFEHLEFNAGATWTVCRSLAGRDVCFQTSVPGEDHFRQPFLRSPDGRHVYWPFGGALVDLETLLPLTATRAIPETTGSGFDFEVDRPGITLALEGRLVTFAPDGTDGAWVRSGDARASAPFGVLGGAPLHTLAALGGRQYLVVRGDGVLARLDARTSEEVWRVSAAGLGEIRDVQLNPERRHALVMGSRAWRMFRLGDGFAISGLLAPPPVVAGGGKLSDCTPHEAPGPEGEIVVRCGGAAHAWQPHGYEGDIAPQLARVTCAAGAGTSALDAARRCFVRP